VHQEARAIGLFLEQAIAEVESAQALLTRQSLVDLGQIVEDFRAAAELDFLVDAARARLISVERHNSLDSVGILEFTGGRWWRVEGAICRQSNIPGFLCGATLCPFDTKAQRTAKGAEEQKRDHG
jgi:hypothetical protein